MKSPTALLSVQEACAHLSVSRTTVWRLVSDGDIRAVKIGRRKLFTMEELQAFVQRNLTLPKRRKRSCG